MNESTNSTQTLNIREIWQLLIRNRWYLIMPVMIVPLTAILATFFLSPVYESSTSILMNEASILPPAIDRGLETRQGYRRQSVSDLRNLLSNQIKSTKYIKSLVAKLDIPLPEGIKTKVAEKAITLPNVSEAELSENLLVESIRKLIDVQMSGSNLIILSARSSSPTMARSMTLTLAEIFLEESLAQELAGIQGSISFTEEQLAVYREKLYNAQNRLKQFRQNLIVSSIDEDTTTLNYNLNSIISIVEALDIDISEAERLKTDITLSLQPYQIEPSLISIPDNIKKLKNDLMNTIPRLAELLGRYSWRDAKVMDLNQEAKNITTNLNNEIELFIVKAYPGLSPEVQTGLSRFLIVDINIQFMQTKIMSLEKSIGKIKSRLTRDPDVEVTLERLQSEVSRYRDLYNTLVQYSQYAAINQSAMDVEAKRKYMIVKPAAMPFAPISPNRMKMAVMGLILGLMIGGGVILILVMLDDSFKKVEEVEDYLKLSVMATIPRIISPFSNTKKDRGLVYAGTSICIILIAAILYMKFRNG